MLSPNHWTSREFPFLKKFLFYYYYFFGQTAQHVGSVPRPRIEPTTPAVEARNLNRWTTREVLPFFFKPFILKGLCKHRKAAKTAERVPCALHPASPGSDAVCDRGWYHSRDTDIGAAPLTRLHLGPPALNPEALLRRLSESRRQTLGFHGYTRHVGSHLEESWLA